MADEQAAMSSPMKAKKTTLSAADWERAALDLIAERGVNALAVEPLARSMGITKGSFYWHFPNREALLLQALARWEAHDARNLTTALSAINDPRERLGSFFRASSREIFTAEVYTALLFASDDPAVETVLERVAARRMEHLAQAFSELGMSPEQARMRAQLSYSAYVGFLQLQYQRQTPSYPSADYDQYVEHVIDSLIPGAP